MHNGISFGIRMWAQFQPNGPNYVHKGQFIPDMALHNVGMSFVLDHFTDAGLLRYDCVIASNWTRRT